MVLNVHVGKPYHFVYKAVGPDSIKCFLDVEMLNFARISFWHLYELLHCRVLFSKAKLVFWDEVGMSHLLCNPIL